MSTEDDTIRDQMDSGYVATRPRFTRARRSWKVNVRNLEAEDVRALDQFTMLTAARGANSFFYPNILTNGSFEFPANGSGVELVRGWYLAGVMTPAVSIAPYAFASGSSLPGNPIRDASPTAMLFATVAGQSVAPGASTLTSIDTRFDTPIVSGEQYLFHCRHLQIGAEDPNITFTLSATLITEYAGYISGNVTIFGSEGNMMPASQWSDFYTVFTIPDTAILNTSDFRLRLAVNLYNASGSAITLNGSNVAMIDEAACALLKPADPFGRMAGSLPLGCPVRFAKLPEIADVGFGGGAKRYGAAFELAEV